MRLEITKGMFRDEFARCGRGEQFSYEGLGALYDYLEEVHGGEYDLDVIALCCEYSEDSYEEVIEQYDLKSIEELSEKTAVIWTDAEKEIVLYAQF